MIEQAKARRCVVAGINADGDEDLSFIQVMATEQQVDRGAHFTAARRWYRFDRDGVPGIVFDEQTLSGRALMPLFCWESSSTIDVK